MTVQARFVFDSHVFDLLAEGWHIKREFVPASARFEPVVATGLASADYAGGELVEEFITDVSLSLPLLYVGDGPQVARRALESFLRRGVATKRLRLQLRTDRAFTMLPLWGQWGAWQTYEIIHAGSLMSDTRVWDGDERDYAHMLLPLVCRPAILGQEQLAANALGDVSEDIGTTGLSAGVIVANDDSSALVLDSASGAVTATTGTIVIAWKRGAESLSGNTFLFRIKNGGGMYYDHTGQQWNIISAWGTEDPLPCEDATDPRIQDEGEMVVFHIAYDAAGNGGEGDLLIYRDGQFCFMASGAQGYTPSVEDLYLGTDDDMSSGIGGTFLFLATYDEAMAAKTMEADYADIAAALESAGSPSPIPYVWTPNGDGVFDNARDDSGSTGAPHYNYGWIAGVAGSLPAAMEMRLVPSATGDTIKRLALSLVDYDAPIDPLTTAVLYHDLSGTSNAASSGGAYLSTTVDTTFALRVSTTQADAVYQALAGRDVCIYCRLQSGSAGNFQIKLAVVMGATSTSRAKNIATATAFRLVRTPFLTVPKRTAQAIADAAEANIQLYAGRSSSSGTALFDYGVVMVRPLVEIDTSGLGSVGVAVYEDTANRYALSGTLWAPLPRAGDVLRPRPHRYNLLMMVMGSEAVDPLTSWSVTATITITPRWSVL